MKSTLSDEALNQVFREGRTHSTWLDKPVNDEILRQLYDLMKWGPTSANGSPARFVFLRTPEAKERLRPALAPGNVEKTISIVTGVWDIWIYRRNLPPTAKHSQLADNTPKLIPQHDPHSQSPPSITERTTRHLNVPEN